MAFLIKRAGSTSGGKNLNKSSRRFTKDDISGPIPLPYGGSQSLPNSTLVLNEAMKGHKRGKSEPFPAVRGGWASLIGGRWSSGITKLVISGVSNSRNATGSRFSTQLGSQSIQIIFPQTNKDKSLPATPHLEHLSPVALGPPSVTFTNIRPKSSASLVTERERPTTVIVCKDVGSLVGQDNAEYVETQYVTKRENEDAEDMYATNMSLFDDVSVDRDQGLEPAWDDQSMARPTSVCTGKTTTYSVIIGDDSSVYYTPEEVNDHGIIGTPYVPAAGTFLERVSKSLVDAEIPHTIRKIECVVPLPTLKEGGNELEATNAPADMVLQLYREGPEDLEEELLAKEIILRRGSRQLLRTHTRKRSVEEAQELLMRRKAQRFPSSFSVEEDLATFGVDFLLQLVDYPEEKSEGLYDEDSDEDRPPSEY